jgi:hypothetical protein
LPFGDLADKNLDYSITIEVKKLTKKLKKANPQA